MNASEIENVLRAAEQISARRRARRTPAARRKLLDELAEWLDAHRCFRCQSNWMRGGNRRGCALCPGCWKDRDYA